MGMYVFTRTTNIDNRMLFCQFKELFNIDLFGSHLSISKLVNLPMGRLRLLKQKAAPFKSSPLPNYIIVQLSNYPFMLARNSSLLLVPFIRFCNSRIASSGFISVR